MKRIALLVAAIAIASVACLDDFDVDDTTYPCRADADCVEGFACDRVRYVCVDEDEAVLDAGFVDAGTSTTS